MVHQSSFDITDAAGFFAVVVEPQYRAFQAQRHSAREALLAIIAVYHLREWLRGDNRHNIDDPSLNELHRLAGKVADGTKHFRSKAQTRRHSGGFSDDFSTDFDVSGLVVQQIDGTELYVDILLDRLVGHWRTVFTEVNLV